MNNIKANLFVQNDLYYVILSYRDINNKRKQKWVSTKISAKGNNKRLANQKLEEIKQNYTDYLPQELSLVTNTEAMQPFELYLNNWLKSHKHKIEENTYYSYNLIVRKTTEYFKDKNIKLKDFKPVHIQKFYDFLYSKGLSGNSVLHYHAVIRKALDTAVKLEIISTNPADKIERPKKNQFIGSYYSIEELNLLFEKSKGDPLELIILLTSFYGLRRSEVLRVKNFRI